MQAGRSPNELAQEDEGKEHCEHGPKVHGCSNNRYVAYLKTSEKEQVANRVDDRRDWKKYGHQGRYIKACACEEREDRGRRAE